MPSERTYGDDEVAEIFRTAAQPVPTGQGLTLAELQAIASQAGLAPERVAEAAAALDLRREPARRSLLGAPVSASRAIELPRAPTDREWEMIVADLRETFGATGRTASRGEVREWSIGNLHAYVEPTPTGHRLRLGTRKGNAPSMDLIAAAPLVMGLVTAFTILMHGAAPSALLMPLALVLLGVAILGGNVFHLRGWAGEREEQMDAVATRTLALLAAPGTAAPHEEEPVGG
jgi:hypothetical protein